MTKVRLWRRTACADVLAQHLTLESGHDIDSERSGQCQGDAHDWCPGQGRRTSAEYPPVIDLPDCTCICHIHVTAKIDASLACRIDAATSEDLDRAYRNTYAYVIGYLRSAVTREPEKTAAIAQGLIDAVDRIEALTQLVVSK
jgi:hypothetical protein